jgi:N-methylhydantoinase B
MSGSAADVTVLHHALVGAAEEMGEVLRRSSFSPNIKERQDYSCALFDARGRLLAQAAHLPVHLGSMAASVRAVIDSVDFMRDGDFAIVNDPYNGGTHLPDITMVAPVYRGARLIGYAANRAHHSDIGGASPGSMSPQTDLIAEGLVIPPVLIERDSIILPDILGFVLANTRTPNERRSDLLAQMAACDKGILQMLQHEGRFGQREFAALCDALLDHSRALMRANLRRFTPGTYPAEDVLDDDGAGTADIPIRVSLTASKRSLTFDFTGSSPQVRGGVNAVRAVTESAVFYSVLAFCDPLPPVNHGCFECIRVVTPEGSVVDARRPAPVAGGNVETSQRIVDVCLAALAQAAPGRGPSQSQGTMNNVSIGGAQPFTYYETIAGGCGAGPRGHGAHATHSHMTNTLNTPVEALEHAYPLRVEEYSIRDGSGGKGSHKGGDGVIRRIRALVQSQFGLLSERRSRGPGGTPPGEPGRNRVIRADGSAQDLPAKCSGELAPGDQLEIQTPGGGGWTD